LSESVLIEQRRAFALRTLNRPETGNTPSGDQRLPQAGHRRRAQPRARRDRRLEKFS
jgi:hypothetical protein